MQNSENYWWYITLAATSGDEEILHSLADMTGSIGAEYIELPEGAKLRAFYRSNHELSYWKESLAKAMRNWNTIKIEDFGKIENQPWNVAAQEAFPPLPVGRNLVVLAPWHKGSEPKDRIPLYINPGSAFGTGYHESTQITLELLEQYIEEGVTTADIGTGSGILTIGALKMGAEESYARDIDPTVIEEVRKNFGLNFLDESRIDLAVGDLLKDFTHKADILTANILLDPLTTMLGDVPGVLNPGGTAIFSGMLETEKDVFLRALADAGMEPVQEHVKGDWWGVAAKTTA